MRQKFIFTAAGLGDLIKGRLYRLVPEKENQSNGTSEGEGHELTLPLFGTLGERSGVRLSNAIGRNIIIPLVIRGNGQSITLPEAVVSVNRKKRIVKTEIVGGSGTVKEFVGDDDTNIDITVGVVATDGQSILDEYPEDAMYDLIDVLEATRLEVWSPFLQLFDIDGGTFGVVVESYSVTQSTHTNRQVVQIRAVSDADYVIYNEES
jgi:hypothetical protein